MTRSNPPVSSAAGSQLDQIYTRRFAGQELRRKQVWEVLIHDYFQLSVRPEDSVLDLGAGYCEFINSIHANQKFALDLNPATARHAAEGVVVLSQDVARDWDVPSNSVDVVFTSNFLEHLETKALVVHCLREVARVLRPGGRFIALGPNIRFCHRVYWDYFDHHVPLSDRSMIEALETNGFRAEAVIPRFLPYTMRGKVPAHPFLVKLYLKFPLLWRIFGEQFLIVART